MPVTIRRRELIAAIGGAAAMWPLAARAQQSAMPVVGFVSGMSFSASERQAAAFRKGLSETGYLEGQNVAVEYHWLNGQYDQLPSLMAELVRRRVAVIATPGSHPAALAAKAATTTIPEVFAVADDPVKLGLVASIARPGGNATGVNFFVQEVAAKRLGLLHDLVPKAVRIAVLINPANVTTAEATLREIPESRARTWIGDSDPKGQHQPRNRRGLHHARARPGSTRSLSRPIRSSKAGASNLRRLQRAMRFPPLIPFASM